MTPILRAATVALAAFSTVSSPMQAVASGPVATALGASSADDAARLRTLAWRDDGAAQMTLAAHLAEAGRRGDASAMLEAAFWAGRAWQSPRAPSTDAMAGFVAANCGNASIARHWVCSDGE